MYQFDKRIVMTLDAGGTNFVFSAIQCHHYSFIKLIHNKAKIKR